MTKKCTSLKLSSDAYNDLKVICIRSNRKIGDFLDDIIAAFVKGGDALLTLRDDIRLEEKVKEEVAKEVKETVRPGRHVREAEV